MKTNLNNFGTHVADEICSKTIWNKCQIYSLSIATLSFKLGFNFFLCNGTLKHRTSESFRGCNRPISCFFQDLHHITCMTHLC